MNKTSTVITVKKPKNKPRKKVVKEVIQTIKVSKPKRINRSSISSRLGLLERDTVNGFEKLLQSYFSGTSGIHRGIAYGTAPTALCRFKQVTDVSVPAGGAATFTWCPFQASNTQTFAVRTFTGTTTSDPFDTSIVGSVGAVVSGPLASTTAATSGRLVRASLRITPTSPILNKSGFLTAAYVPALFRASPAPTSMVDILPGYGTTGLKPSTLENFSQFKTFDGSQNIMLQWVPNDLETRVSELIIDPSITDTEDFVFSGYAGFIDNSSSAVNSYHLEFDYGIEYTPSVSYRPFVDMSVTDVDPRAQYYLNQFIAKHWDEVLIATLEQHDVFTASIDHVPLSLTRRYQLANSMAPPILPTMQEAGLMSKAADLMNNACERIEQASGIDVCGGLMGAAKGTANYVLTQALNSGTRSPYVIMN